MPTCAGNACDSPAKKGKFPPSGKKNEMMLRYRSPNAKIRSGHCRTMCRLVCSAVAWRILHRIAKKALDKNANRGRAVQIIAYCAKMLNALSEVVTQTRGK